MCKASFHWQTVSSTVHTNSQVRGRTHTLNSQISPSHFSQHTDLQLCSVIHTSGERERKRTHWQGVVSTTFLCSTPARPATLRLSEVLIQKLLAHVWIHKMIRCAQVAVKWWTKEEAPHTKHQQVLRCDLFSCSIFVYMILRSNQ